MIKENLLKKLNTIDVLVQFTEKSDDALILTVKQGANPNTPFGVESFSLWDVLSFPFDTAKPEWDCVKLCDYDPSKKEKINDYTEDDEEPSGIYFRRATMGERMLLFDLLVIHNKMPEPIDSAIHNYSELTNMIRRIKYSHLYGWGEDSPNPPFVANPEDFSESNK